MRAKSYIPAILLALIIFPPLSTASKDNTARQTVERDSESWKRDPFAGNRAAKKSAPAAISARSGPLLSARITKTAPVTTKSSEPEIQLHGILKSGENRHHAIVNGRIVKPGDKIGDYSVIAISRHSVTISKDKGEKLVYDIYQGKLDRGIK